MQGWQEECADSRSDCYNSNTMNYRFTSQCYVPTLCDCSTYITWVTLGKDCHACYH